ncbi:MAG: Sec-independent protein translocase subunit TatA/TatB [Acidimicrobiales bacterium]
MLSLSPAKLLVLLVVALIVLGPEKLPQVARQLGAAWGELRRFRARLESDVRGAFPDLPATHEVAQAVRSPLAFLDRLADEHEKTQGKEGGADPTLGSDEVAGAPLATGPPAATNGNGTSPSLGDPYRSVAVDALPSGEFDDPNMN